MGINQVFIMAEKRFSQDAFLAVVLAAGEGTRMRSKKPKVLHSVAGLPMVLHAVKAALMARAQDLAVVVGPERADVEDAVRGFYDKAQLFTQRERLGTAHAVLAAREAIAASSSHVLVLFGDTPLVRSETLQSILAPLDAGSAVAVAGFEPLDPTGYGRLITRDETLIGIVEEKEASESERSLRLCNAGIMALHKDQALSLLEAVGNSNAKSEYYLTDVVGIAHQRGLTASVVKVPAEDVVGVNDRAQLAEAEALMQARLRRAVMLSGVTVFAPETVFFSHDTVIGSDVLIEPHVVFGLGVQVEQDAVIHAFSHLEGAHVGQGAHIGPYARLRPGTRVGTGSRIGNFVETKNAQLAEGVKINHLSYVGDAEVGRATNIGAGTITCNYDGVSKHKTWIGQGVFVGSNTALVAPVTLGDGALIAAGSVITEDVPASALALGRARQTNKSARATQHHKKQ
jgi:bifunctional UDP-N-acetylglucosamine pyrophosphorylase / glucosamine-1-phosphate N-acetyltransferase